jgi:hypothetical protein
MNVKFAFLAQAASFSSSGDIDAFGILSGRIETNSLPMVIPRLDLVACISIDVAELAQPHHAELRAFKPDGEPFLPSLRRDFPAMSDPPAGINGISETAIQGNTLLYIEAPGIYEFQVIGDDTLLATIPLSIFMQPSSVEAEVPG